MILNFLILYLDELIYSVIVCYVIYNGILSFKYFIEELFNNRNLMLIYDLLFYIGKLVSYLFDCYDVFYLINYYILLLIY